MVEDKIIAMHARHAIAKTPLDISELIITCTRGVIELNGIVKRPRNFSNAQSLNVRKEFDLLKTTIRHSRGVKDVIGDRVKLLE